MNFGKWFGVVFVWLGCGLAAGAQAGAYIGYSATQFTGIQCLSSSTAPCSSTNGKVNPSGVTVGAYYDFRNVGPVRLGLDLRYNHDRSDKTAADTGGGRDATEANTVLLGVRGSVKTPINWMRPYGVVSFGRTSSNLTEPFCSTTSGATLQCSGTTLNAPRTFDSFFRYEVFVGVDLHVLPVVDLRPIELGIGGMNRIGSGGAVNSTSSVGVKSIGAALVFHMP